jgi:hypothetical protein
MTKLNETTKVRPSDLLAVAAAIAAGTQAYGEVIIFINPEWGEPGHFDWLLGDEFDATTWLDITHPSTDQGGLVGASSISQVFYQRHVPYGVLTWIYTSGGASVATTQISSPDKDFTRALDAGDPIDGSLRFESTATHYYGAHAKFGGSYVTDFGIWPNVKYLGVRFSDVDGVHYGWVGVYSYFYISDFEAFAWGYETEPGVPIIAGIPAPGTLAALAFGAVVTRRGRKRKND